MMRMLKTMRWYGPNDGVSLADLQQCGIEGVVTALHHVPAGEVWAVEAIQERQNTIKAHGLEWSVVESLPVHEHIKRQAPGFEQYIENYKASLRNLAACNIMVVTYNFMPVLDWVRTNHNYANKDGTKALAFSHSAFAYFDLELLKRPGADDDYTIKEIEEAKHYGERLEENEKNELFKQVLLGLPGSTTGFTAEEVLRLLKDYKGINDDTLRHNLIYFLSEIIPVAEEVGVNLAIHPDDPPFSVLGLPRIMCTQEDAQKVFDAVPSNANGLCYCTGSFGAHPDNNLLAMIDTFENRIHFLHLRNVKRTVNGDFRESAHLDGDNPMAEIVAKLLHVMQKRKIRLPMRPDHGFLHSIEVEKVMYPGYSLVGRLKGLAELTGLEQGLLHNQKELEKAINEAYEH